jgi:hypothetical protein
MQLEQANREAAYIALILLLLSVEANRSASASTPIISKEHSNLVLGIVNIQTKASLNYWLESA